MRAYTYGILTAAVLLCGIGVLSSAQGPQVPTGTWAGVTVPMAGARTNASAAQLHDGRLLITGGVGTQGALASAELFQAESGFSLAAPMKVARSRHSSVVLANGRVLVAGGASSDGSATRSVEVYDPFGNSWSILGNLEEPRTGASAVLLGDGRVLVAGGENAGIPSSTVELFDPVTHASTLAGTMSAARSGHAAALLKDGSVLIVGGSDGTSVLSSADVFDPKTGSILATGRLSSPRVGLSATALLDGRVLVVGGSNGSKEWASAELYDAVSGTFTPASSALRAERRDHLAFLLPNNNSVLIVGGVAAGSPVPSADLYVPWTGEFRATGTPLTAREGAAGGAVGDGLLLVAGGNGLASAEGYAFATVKTDKDDYAPGQPVTITGTGWQPGERVTIVLEETPDIDEHPPLTAVADESGSILNKEFAPDQHDIGVRFSLTATGAGSQAQVMFSDSVTLTTTTTVSSIASPLVIGQPVAASGLVSADLAVPDGAPIQLQAELGGCAGGFYFTLASISATTSGGTGSFSFSGTVPAFGGTFGLRAHFPGITVGDNTWAASDSACQPVTIVEAAKLTVTAIVVNDNGGTKVAGDFQLSVDGNAVTSGSQITVGAGTHTVSQLGTFGYVGTIGGDCAANGTISLVANAVKSCTISNSDTAPQLTLNAATSYTHGGTAPESSWTLTATGPTPLSGPGASGAADVVSGPTFSAGLYTLSESAAPAGYTNGASYSCVTNGGAPVLGNTIALGVGDVAVCTITNTDAGLSIGTGTTLNAIASPQVIGQAVAVDGQVTGSPAVPNGLPVQLQAQVGGCFAGGYLGLAIGGVTSGGTGSFTLAGTVPALPGTYGLRAHFAGATLGGSTWAASDSACQTVTIAAPPQLTVTTVVVNNNGGTKTVSDFALFVDATPVTSGAPNTLSVGPHTVSETPVTGYVTTIGGDCAANGTITLAAGDVKSCTVTNTDAGLSIGTGTTLSAIASPQVIGQAVAVGGQVAASPAVPNGLPVQLQAQVGGCFAGGYLGLAIGGVTSGGTGSFTLAGTVPALPGTYGLRAHFAGATLGGSTWAASDSACQTVTIAAPPQLTVTTVVVNNNGGTKTVSDFALFVDATPVTSGAPNTLSVGAHTVSETPVTGYVTTIAGDCAANGTITLAAGDVKSCTVTNTDAGLSIGTGTTLSAIASPQVIGQAVAVGGQVAASPAVPNGLPVQLQAQVGGCFAGGYLGLAIGGVTSGGTGSFTLAGTVPALPGTYGLRAHFAGATLGGSTWAASDSACQTVTIAAPPQLTVTTVVVNNNGGTKTVSDFALFVDATPVTSGAPSTLSVGAHTVSETPVTGYVTTIAGDCAANGTITLAAGDVKSCTVTNTDAGLSIGTGTTLSAIASPQVIGQAVAVGGQVAASPAVPNGLPVQLQAQVGGCFAGGYLGLAIGGVTSGGTGSFTLAGTVPALPGTYGLRAHFAGATLGGSTWAASDSACQTVTIAAPPQLTVTTVVVNNNGGTKTVSDFALFVDATPVTSGAPNTLGVGAHTVSETPVTGYVTTIGGDCAATGTITLAAGDVKSCTVTNTDAGLSIGTGTTLSAIASPQVIGQAVAVGGQVAASPAVPNGLPVQLQAQVGGCFAGGYLGLAIGGVTSGGTGSFTLAGTVPALPGTYGLRAHFAGATLGGSTWAASDSACQTVTIAAPPQLTVTTVVVNNNGGTKTVSDFALFVDATPVTSGAPSTLSVGAHTVSETPVTGYVTTIGGDCAANGTITLAAGDVKSCTVTNTDAGLSIGTGTTLSAIASPQVIGQAVAVGGQVAASPAVPNGLPVQLQAQVGGCFAGGYLGLAIGGVTSGGTGSFTLAGTVPALPGTYGLRAHFAGATLGGSTWAASDSACQTVTIVAAPGTESGSIRVVQRTVEGHGTFSFSSNFGVTSLTTPGPTARQVVESLVPGDSYHISQTSMPAGWELTSATCTNGTPAAVTVVAGKTTTCVFTNRWIAHKEKGR